MRSEERAKHDEMVAALQPAITIANPNCIGEIMDKIHHDNKRGYLPERVGFVPMILAKRCGEVHKPNQMYLEYVPAELAEEAVAMLLDKFLPTQTGRSDHRVMSSVGSPQVSAGHGRIVTFHSRI